MALLLPLPLHSRHFEGATHHPSAGEPWGGRRRCAKLPHEERCAKGARACLGRRGNALANWFNGHHTLAQMIEQEFRLLAHMVHVERKGASRVRRRAARDMGERLGLPARDSCT